MRNATLPPKALLHDYDLGVAALPEGGTVRTSLTDRRADVAALHQHYDAVGGRPHLMTSTLAWPKTDKLAQLALYPLTNKGRPLEELRGAVLKAAGRRCLLCASDRPTSLDHVLPKAKHPALSVLPTNLIGACEPCNRRKLSTCLADPEKQFIHPYYDTLPQDIAWLQCTPLSADGHLAPSFRVEGAPGMDQELARRLQWQFGRLHLGDYYSDEAIVHCTTQAMGWLEVFDGSDEDFRLVLERELRSVRRPFGDNVWQAALLRGLLADAVFMRTAPVVLERLLLEA